MKSAKYFTSINFYSRTWQYHIAHEDIPKTLFLMRYGLRKWVVMPMGPTRAPTTFMNTMNNLSSNTLDCGVVVFLDNILAYAYMVKEHFMLESTGLLILICVLL